MHVPGRDHQSEPVKKGASKESTFAFSFASTNIVFELGILIYVLPVPIFLRAEILGGFALIAIMYLLVRAIVPDEVFEEARRRMHGEERDGEEEVRTENPFRGYTGKPDLTSHQGKTYRFHSESCLEAFKQQVAARGDWEQQLRGLVPDGGGLPQHDEQDLHDGHLRASCWQGSSLV